MENMEKVQELERELEALKLKVTSLEEGLKNAQMRIDTMTATQQTAAKQTANSAQIPQTNNIRQQAAPVGAYSYARPVQTATYAAQAATPTAQSTAYNYAAGNQSTAAGGSSYAAPQNMQQMRPASPRNTESWVGKVLMGAVASLLVFIALIIFARLLLPYVTNELKIAFMFAGSIALTAAGFVLSKRKPENTFCKALLACGTACIYLSILVTGIHFKAINQIVMYALIALWALLMIFLKAGKDDWLFFSIGNLGYFVSVAFTGGLKDEALIIPMLIYAVMIGAIYQIMYIKNLRQRDAQSIINVVILLLLQLIITMKFRYNTEIYIVSAVAIVWTFAGFMIYSMSDLFKYRKHNFYLAAVHTLGFLGAYLLINSRLEFPALVSFAAALIPAIIFEIVNIFWKIRGLAKNESLINASFAGLLFYAAALILANADSLLFKSGIIMITYLMIAVYGFFKKDRFFKIHGWVLVTICMCLGFRKDAGLFFALVALLITLSSLIIEGYILNDSLLFKILSYLLLFAWIGVVGDLIADLPGINPAKDIVYLVTYGIIAAANIFLTLTGYYRTNERKNGRDLHIVMDTVNLFLILFGACAMGISNDTVLKVIYMVLVFVLASINLPIRGKGNKERNLYTGLKFGILVLYSLNTFETPSFIISIIMIAFSVLCIAIGFKNRQLTKELRILGLITTLLFVFKFIVIDISFDSSVLKALSYLMAGILCFGISALYNHFEKTTARPQPQQFQQPGQPQQQYQQPQQ